MAQRVTLAIPNPTNGAVDTNVSATNPLPVVSGTSTSPDIVGGEYNSTPPTLTTGQTDALQLTASGSLRAYVTGDLRNGADAQSNGSLVAVGSDTSQGTQTRLLMGASFVFNGTTWDRTRGDTTGTYTVAKGTSTIANAQGSVTTTTGQMVPARVGRSSVTIINESTTVIRYGAAGVTAANGAYLAGVAGTAVTIPTAAAVHGIVGTGTAAFSYIENF